jgi:hypothetical protein
MTEPGKQDQEASIQRQVNEQEGQLKVLLTFAQTAPFMSKWTPEPNVRPFAAVERMISFRGGSTARDRIILLF